MVGWLIFDSKIHLVDAWSFNNKKNLVIFLKTDRSHKYVTQVIHTNIIKLKSLYILS